MRKAVSIIGVGNMGGGMALNLLSRGYSVQVHDVDAQKVAFYKEKGAVALTEPALAATDFVAVAATIVCVVDAAQTEDVLFGSQDLAASLSAGHTVLLCPTIAAQDVERFSAGLQTLGIHSIDAPMSGGPVRAANGSMSLMVACPDAVFVQNETLLRDLSSQVFRISEKPGDAARTKLVNNLLAAINLAGAAEAIALAQCMGLDASRTLDVIEQSSGQSWIGSERMRRAIAGDFAPRAHMTLLAKDSKLALQMAQSLGFTNPLGSEAAAIFARALEAGLADQDDAAIIKLLR
jgi:L-threonate 2-dehydrogenase